MSGTRIVFILGMAVLWLGLAGYALMHGQVQRAILYGVAGVVLTAFRILRWRS